MVRERMGVGGYCASRTWFCPIGQKKSQPLIFRGQIGVLSRQTCLRSYCFYCCCLCCIDVGKDRNPRTSGEYP